MYLVHNKTTCTQLLTPVQCNIGLLRLEQEQAKLLNNDENYMRFVIKILRLILNPLINFTDVNLIIWRKVKTKDESYTVIKNPEV